MHLEIRKAIKSELRPDDIEPCWVVDAGKDGLGYLAGAVTHDRVTWYDPDKALIHVISSNWDYEYAILQSFTVVDGELFETENLFLDIPPNQFQKERPDLLEDVELMNYIRKQCKKVKK